MVLPTCSTLEPATLPGKRRQERQETMDLVLLSICVKPKKINWDYIRSIDTYWDLNKITCGQFRLLETNCFFQAKMQPIITWSEKKGCELLQSVSSILCPKRFAQPPSMPSSTMTMARGCKRWPEAFKEFAQIGWNLSKKTTFHLKNDFLKIFWCQLNLEVRFWFPGAQLSERAV